ncbi:MAG: hypothetical protein M3O70_10000 [Actinomycetota bacterium]|nr:hypothetical protein [Actinomycetota bacterium]
MAESGIVVDTSKGFPHLLTLKDIFKKRRLFILHLVRDPRAVVFSWTRRRYRPEADDYMEPRGAVGVAIRWLVHNVLISFFGPRMSSGYVRIMYEDVCRDPATVERALKSLGMTGRGAEPSYHSIAGNPMRFTQPQIEIRLDEEWRKVMSDSSRRLAWWLTAPLSRKFGYRRES